MTVLSRLARSRTAVERPRILSTTVNAILQRVPPREKIAADSFSAAPGNAVDMDGLVQWLESTALARASAVRDTGEYAVRGGILDLYAPAMLEPVRLDFFGDTLESIRTFDPETQRTIGQLRGLDLVPMSEVQLTSDSMRRFRQAYVARFGAQTRGDTLYESGERRPPPSGPRTLAAAVLRRARHALRLIPARRRSSSTRRPKRPPSSASTRSPIITMRAKPPHEAALQQFALQAAEAGAALSLQGRVDSTSGRPVAAQVTPHALPEGAKGLVVDCWRQAWPQFRAGTGRRKPNRLSQPPPIMCARCKPGANTSSWRAGRMDRASDWPACSPITG